MIKKIIGKIPFVRSAKNKILFHKEYSYDKNFFKRNFSHSKETKNKIGYNMLLISHSLEKGMANKSPRHFGSAKIKELQRLIEKYAQYGNFNSDFAFVNTINILREYKKFYETKGWEGAEEYLCVKDFLKKYKDIKSLDIGSFTLFKSEFEKDAKINYAKFLASRHSVREFSAKKLKKEDLEKAVRTAILSPSACNRQMCKVYGVFNESKNKKIISLAQGFGGFEKDTINTLVITFDVNANYFIGERNQGWFNAGLFSMNLVNALHSQGIGSCFCQFGNSTKQEEKIKKMLNIPSSERIAVLIACGYYADECLVTRSPRKSLEEIYLER
jgi:nitroreductase